MGAGLGSAAALIILAVSLVLIIRHRRQVSKRSRIVNADDDSQADGANRESHVDVNTPYIYQPPVEMDAKREVNEIAGSPIHEMVGSSILVRAKTGHQTPEDKRLSGKGKRGTI